MGYGRSTPDGHLPVYSVGTEEEALNLLVLACETNIDGRFVAKELVEEQTIENLEKFSQRLDHLHELIVHAGTCTCGGEYG